MSSLRSLVPLVLDDLEFRKRRKPSSPRSGRGIAANAIYDGGKYLLGEYQAYRDANPGKFNVPNEGRS